MLTFFGPEAQKEKQFEFVPHLFGIPGITKITVRRHQVDLERSMVFEWNEILPGAEKILLEWMTKQPSQVPNPATGEVVLA